MALMRAGGNSYNTGEKSDARPPQGLEVYYVSIIDDMRAHGVEPVLTMPFILNAVSHTISALEPNAGSIDYNDAISNSKIGAKEIIRLANIVHKRGVRYVIIGNEADKDAGWGRTP